MTDHDDGGGVDAEQINFIAFKLAWPFLPTMMWSCTATPSGPAVDDRFGHLDIGLRRGRIAEGMIVYEDHCGGG
jgi:hypothetical protein